MVKIRAALIILYFVSSSVFASEMMPEIQFKVSSIAVVIPNSVDRQATCRSSGITGPRVRLRSQIQWSGSGRLVPTSISMKIENRNLAYNYHDSIGVEENFISIAKFLGSKEDYLVSGVSYQSQFCFLDFGKLPLPKTKITGNGSLSVPAVITLRGVVITPHRDMPFVETVTTEVLYAAGSQDHTF